MAVTIPTFPSIPLYTMRTTIEGVEYRLLFDYVGREDRWYLSIADQDEVPLARGIKLVVNWPLLRRRHADPRLPPGELVVVDTTEHGGSPGLDELGESFELVYYSAEELEA